MFIIPDANFLDKLDLLLHVLEIPFIGLGKDGNHIRYVWDGTRLDLHQLSNAQVIHEIGHWIECPTEYKDLPEYGLGTGPDIFSKFVEPDKHSNLKLREYWSSYIGMGLGIGIKLNKKDFDNVCETVDMLDDIHINKLDRNLWINAVRDLNIKWMQDIVKTYNVCTD
jgi:hypothetical protein